MRHLTVSLLLVCACTASAQVAPDPLPFQSSDLDVMEGGLAWLVGDHVEARRHFRTAAQRGDPLGQYNLAMMLLHHEGGRGDSVEATALLRKAADAGVILARDELHQMQVRGAPARGSKRQFAGNGPADRAPGRKNAGSVEQTRR
jgi:TPR repeat protein